MIVEVISPSLGEAVSPEDCFSVSEYPSFLPPLTGCCRNHSAVPHSHSSHPNLPDVATETQRSENCIPLVEEKQAPPTGKKPSAFTPVDTNRVSYVTPDLFAEPAVGKAIASSTPVPRALAFTRSDMGSEVGVANNKTGLGGGGVEVGSVGLGRVRMVLDFGSGPKSSGGGGEGGESHSGTPLFGVLPAPVQGTFTPSPGTPSQITPSPMALPPHFSRQLLSAPAQKRRVSVSLSHSYF